VLQGTCRRSVSLGPEDISKQLISCIHTHILVVFFWLWAALLVGTGTSDLFRGTGARGSEVHIFIPWSKLAIKKTTHTCTRSTDGHNVLVLPVAAGGTGGIDAMCPENIALTSRQLSRITRIMNASLAGCCSLGLCSALPSNVFRKCVVLCRVLGSGVCARCGHCLGSVGRVRRCAKRCFSAGRWRWHIVFSLLSWFVQVFCSILCNGLSGAQGSLLDPTASSRRDILQ